MRGLPVLFWLLWVVSCTPPAPPPAEEVIRPVLASQVYSAKGGRSRTFSGTAKSGQESKISFRIAGTVQRLAVQLGDRVRQGQLIALLDTVDYDLRVDEARAAVQQSQAQLTNAQASYDRALGLFEADNATQADYDTATTAVDSAAAAVEAAQKRLAQSMQQRAYSRLTAPVSGSIAEVHVEVNENVNSGQAVVTLTSGTFPEVEVSIPEQLIAQVQQGVPVTVTFDAIEDEEFAAAVTEVGVSSTQYSTTFQVVARLRVREPRLRPGMAAEVRFAFGDESEIEHLYVPPHTVGEDREGRFVYVVSAQQEGLGSVARRPVEVGELTSLGLEVLDGLEDGEWIATAGIDQLESGLKVRLLER